MKTKKMSFGKLAFGAFEMDVNLDESLFSSVVWGVINARKF